MKIYFRLLSYAKPIEKFAIPYVLFTILSIFFGLMNFTLLVPIFDILFSPDPSKSVPHIEQLPSFSFDVQYLKNLFYYGFDKILGKYGKMGVLEFVCGITLLSVLCTNLFKYLSQRAMESLRIHTLLRLRQALFEKVMSLHLGYFSNERKGVLISKITADVQVIQGSITNTLIVFFKEPITLIVYFGWLFYISYELTLFTILIVPVSGFLISLISKRLKRSAIEAQSTFGMMLSYLDEALSGIRIIKAFNAVGYIQDKFHNQNLQYTKIIRSMARRQELSSPISEFLGVSVVVAVLLYGGAIIISDPSFKASLFLGYIIVFSQIINPVKSISNSFSAIQHGVASGERVLKIIDTPNEVEEKKNAIKISEFKNEIEFKNVSLGYESKEVLKNISFKITAGKTIALVGPSGGGKSTISDLIPRFYDPKKGQILIDGIDIKEFTFDSLRGLMGIVNQESILFNDTIYNNIAFGKSNASKEEVFNAARIANAHEFILNTDKGYETFIGDRGVKLSGGQKQRISIARAILKNPPILILDEATSALDTESEKLVQDALDNLMKNRTSLVIAHRLSTIQAADEIIVIESGEIVERGNHKELLEMNTGLYRKLKLMQAV